MTDLMGIDCYTKDARDIARRAMTIASQHRHSFVDTRHMLLALVEQPKEIISYILEQLNVDIDQMYQRVSEMVDGYTPVYNSEVVPNVVLTTPHVRQMLKYSNDEASKFGDGKVSAEHLLLGIIGGQDYMAGILLSWNITRKHIYGVLGGTNDEIAAQKVREAAWNKIPEIKIEVALQDTMYKGIRVLSDIDDTHHLDILLKYLTNYEITRPENFAGLYWVEQNVPYIAWFHYTEGKKPYFHRPGRKEYLASAEWKKKRLLVIDRDHNRCVVCRSSTSLQVHHRTYEHFGNEPLEDLVTLCQQCHSIIHERRPFRLFCPVYPDSETT